jgi:hypothetical protein
LSFFYPLETETPLNAACLKSLKAPASATVIKHDKEHHHVTGDAADHDHDSAHHKKHDHKGHHPEHKKGAHGHDKDHKHVDTNADHSHDAKHHKDAKKPSPEAK